MLRYCDCLGPCCVSLSADDAKTSVNLWYVQVRARENATGVAGVLRPFCRDFSISVPMTRKKCVSVRGIRAKAKATDGSTFLF